MGDNCRGGYGHIIFLQSRALGECNDRNDCATRMRAIPNNDNTARRLLGGPLAVPRDESSLLYKRLSQLRARMCCYVKTATRTAVSSTSRNSPPPPHPLPPSVILIAIAILYRHTRIMSRRLLKKTCTCH